MALFFSVKSIFFIEETQILFYFRLNTEAYQQSVISKIMNKEFRLLHLPINN